jgi:hypothetical protein
VVAKDPFDSAGLQHSALTLSGLLEEKARHFDEFLSCAHTLWRVFTHWQWLHRNPTAPHMLITVVDGSVAGSVAAATAVLLRLLPATDPYDAELMSEEVRQRLKAGEQLNVGSMKIPMVDLPLGATGKPHPTHLSG